MAEYKGLRETKMKIFLLLILVLLVGVGVGLLVKRTFSVNKQIENNTVQICPPECFPDKKTCG